jgi:peptidoglycan biosynthesis protein MviN/MurJ (putative lipid II flippase)
MYLMNAATITIASNVALSLALVFILGMLGVAIATTISLIIGSTYYFIVFHRELKLPLIDFLRTLALLPMAASVIPSILVYLLYYGLSLANLGTGWVINFIVLTLGGLLFVSIYLLIILKSTSLDEYDMGLIQRYMSLGNIISLIRVREIK